MNHLLIVLALTAVTASADAADKPDFSGEWKMNPSKSSYGAIPAPGSLTRKITHDEPSITIAEDQTAGAMEVAPSRQFTTDGQATTFFVNGAEVEGSATWESAVLLVQSKVTAVGLQFNDRMSLSADGKLLTSKVQIISDQGEVAMTVVFDRQENR